MACSRHILKRQLAAAAELGFSFNLGIETEFFLFKDTEDGGLAPISDRDVLDKPCYDPSVLMDNLPIIDEIVDAILRASVNMKSVSNWPLASSWSKEYTSQPCSFMVPRSRR